MLNTRAVWLGALALSAQPLWCQVASSDVMGQIESILEKKLRDTKPDDPQSVKDLNTYLGNLTDVYTTHRTEYVQYLGSRPAHVAYREKAVYQGTFVSALEAVENGRVDEQAGGPAGVGAAASAAEKAGITGLITGAFENGAMTQTLDQNLLTLRGNAEGLFRFLTGQQVLPICETAEDVACDPSPLNNLELSASFDVSGSNSTMVSGQDSLTGAQIAGLLTSNKKQFSSASARYVIIGSRDLRSPAYRTAWKAWYDANSQKLAATTQQLLLAAQAIFTVITRAPALDARGNPKPDTNLYDDWAAQASAAVNAAVESSKGKDGTTRAREIVSVLADQYNQLESKMRSAMPDFDQKLETLSSASAQYFNATRAGFALADQPMLTAEFTYSEPTAQPKLLTGKVIFAWSPKQKGTANPGTLTLNGGFDFYTKPQTAGTNGGTSRFRDAQFALQFDRPLGGKGNPATLTIGSYIQYQMNPGLIVIPPGSNLLQGITLPPNGAQILTQKGTIAVVNASVTLQLPNSGIRLPIGFSYSNRTDLVTGNEIRGHIGLSFDTHSLLLASDKQQ